MAKEKARRGLPLDPDEQRALDMLEEVALWKRANAKRA
jgi:hypothetical protein